jgi:cell division protein FtsB
MDAARLVWLRRTGIAVAVAVALGYVPYHLYGSTGLARYLKLRAERDALHEANLRTRLANLRLMRELDGLVDPQTAQPSSAAIERAARDELGLVRPGEIVFQLERTR